MNCYLDLIPLQELEDWLSAWAQSGEMPISMAEFGTPLFDFVQPDMAHAGITKVHEHFARLFKIAFF